MSKKLPFVKMHALGNDFLLLDLIRHCVSLSPAQICNWSDRHKGVGFDQMLCVEPPQDAQADFFMRIYNADGSPAAQCGNGVRCFYQFVRESGLTGKDIIFVQTAERIIKVERNAQNEVIADMGEANMDWNAVLKPEYAQAQNKEMRAQGFLLETKSSGDVTIEAYPVSMGNPHLVLFVANKEQAQKVFDTCAAELAEHPATKDGANVGVTYVQDLENILLQTYERGSAATLACGSNSCAVAAVAMQLKTVSSSVAVHSPGGRALISQKKAHMHLQSEVHNVFSGTLPVK